MHRAPHWQSIQIGEAIIHFLPVFSANPAVDHQASNYLLDYLLACKVIVII